MTRLPTLALLGALAPFSVASAQFGSSHASSELFVRTTGDAVQAVVEVSIDPGWHLYHDDLGPDDAIGKPTRLVLDAPGVLWEEPEFDDPERYPQLGLGEGGRDTWINGHEGELVIRVRGVIEDSDVFELDDVVAEIDGLTCEDNGMCVPYAEQLENAGRGSDALFDAFGATVVEAPEPAFEAFGSFGSSDGNHARAEVRAGVDGELVLVEIEVEIDFGWHLYHDDLGPDDAIGLPTTVRFSGTDVEFDEVRFSEPERFDQPGLGKGGRDTYILGHEGELRILASGWLEGGGAFAPEDLLVELTGQTCETDGLCVEYSESVRGRAFADAAELAAVSAEFAPEPLLIGSAKSAPSPEPIAVEAGSTADLEDGDDAEDEDEGDDGLMAFLGLAVFWGLFTLLMPCTYPMIPITISFFTKQAESNKGGVLPLALAYGAGIIGIFVAIGVLVGPAIITFATHPVVNIVIGLAFFYFALVLFGAIRLDPPAFLMNAAGKASSRGGLVGVFLMGATLVITSFTCTAPFVGSLLSVGATGEGASLSRIALGMATFGATMAIPFVALSLVPGRLSSIPSAGAWMNTLKVSLGFVELAAALKFISNADLVLQWHFLSRELFLIAWMGIFLTGALYLFGLIRLKGESGEIGAGRFVSAIGFLMFALYMGYGASGRELDRVMVAIAPPYSGAFVAGAGAGLITAGDAAGVQSREHVIFVDDYDGAVAAALSADKLLMVNFTGHTCVNCRQMELKVFPKDPVRAELAEYFVEARLHTDGQANIEQIKALQKELAGTVANPYYVLVDPESGDRLGEGSWMQPEDFAELLRSARERAGRS